MAIGDLYLCKELFVTSELITMLPDIDYLLELGEPVQVNKMGEDPRRVFFHLRLRQKISLNSYGVEWCLTRLPEE
jgi:hypothetical protein